MKVSDLLKSKHVVAGGNTHPALPVAPEESRHSEVNDKFEPLDGTNPSKPYSQQVIMKAMAELFKRIERQAANYGGDIDHKTGKIDRSKHRFFPAKIAREE